MVEVNKAEENRANGNGNAPVGGSSGTRTLEPEQFRKLFIGGLSLNTTDESLKDFYSQFGELLDCVVMRDGQTKKSRGFGFVSFATKEEVDRAMDSRPHEIDGKTVDPKRAVPRDQSSRSESNISTKRLYVSGVREEHTEAEFNQYFGNFGKVVKVEIITDKVTEKPRGFAFVTFDDHDAVDKCVLMKSHMISNYRCDVKKALSKDDMNRAQQQDRDRMDRGNRSRGSQRNGPGAWGGGRGGGPGGYGGRDGGGGGGGGYGAWGPPAGAWAGGPPGQWGPDAGAYGGGYGGGYGAYGGAPNSGGGWGAAPAAAAAGGPPAAQWGAQAAAAGGWGGGGAWSNDVNAGGWGGSGAAGAGTGSAPQGAGQQWPANASGGGQWASNAGGPPAGNGAAPPGGQRF